MSEIEHNKNEGPSSRPTRSRFNFSNAHFDVSDEKLPDKHEQSSDRRPSHRNRIRHVEKSGPLIFNVAQLLRDHDGATRDYDYAQDQLHLNDPLEDEEEATSSEATNIKGHIRFTKVRHEVLTQGPGSADVTLNCVRCLNDYQQHLDYTVEEVFQPTIDLITGLPPKLDAPEDEADLKIDSNHLLDLGEAIRQQILVSVPMQPICREDCPGLYEYLDKINADFEEAVAEAETEEDELPADPRWTALSKLKLDQ
jgi:uncharacterized protein